MPKKVRRKSSPLPKVLVIAGIVLVASVILILKSQSKAVPISARINVLPEAQLERALQARQPTLAFYHSTSCKQCIVMMDIVGQVYPEYVDSIMLIDIDVYDESNVPLLNEVGLQFIPTLMFYDHHGKRQVHVGIMEADQLRQTLANLAEGE